MKSLVSRIAGAAIGVALLTAGSVHAQSVEVVASGLNNPRGLAFAPNGDLYVAEAGSGGTEFCHTGPTGPHDVSFQGQGNLFVTVGFGGEPDLREALEEESGTMGVLGRVTADGAYRIVSDIATFENEENPDGELPDSNVYGVLALAGKVVVADAGADALFEISANGAIRTLASATA